jgi:hypothetical protein
MMRPSIRRSFCSNSQIWMRAFCTESNSKSQLITFFFFKGTHRSTANSRILGESEQEISNSLTLWRNRKIRFCPPTTKPKEEANRLGTLRHNWESANEERAGEEGGVRWAGSWYAGPWWTPWLLLRRQELLPLGASESAVGGQGGHTLGGSRGCGRERRMRVLFGSDGGGREGRGDRGRQNGLKQLPGLGWLYGWAQLEGSTGTAWRSTRAHISWAVSHGKA